MKTILIIEDNDDDYYALTRLFQRAGVQNPVQRCTGGKDALECLAHCTKALPPGLILLDLNMPDTDGREVLARVKTQPKLAKTPVIVLTTSLAGADVRRCYDTGADAYLFKPLEMELLLKALARIKEENRQIDFDLEFSLRA